MHLDKYTDVATLHTLAETLRKDLGEVLKDVHVANRELTVVTTAASIIEVLTHLRDNRDCQFRMLVDICGADYPGREQRFEVVYHLLSLTKNRRIRVKIAAGEGESVPTAVEVFPNANWYERETFDMFGVLFENHPDMRRILTDYGFVDFPLRKDFPVEGKVEMFYDEEQKRCVYRPTNLRQDFRHFDWDSPWKGMDNPFGLAEEDNVNAFSQDEFSEGKQ